MEQAPTRRATRLLAISVFATLAMTLSGLASPTALAANTTYWIVYNSSGSSDDLYKTGDGSGNYRTTGAVS